MMEFDCEGCGYRVISFGNERSRHWLCAICFWLMETEPPATIMETRRRMEPGGWISERQRRGKEHCPN